MTSSIVCKAETRFYQHTVAEANERTGPMGIHTCCEPSDHRGKHRCLCGAQWRTWRRLRVTWSHYDKAS